MVNMDCRPPGWWRDGLVWSCIGIYLMGLLVGIAFGVVMWR